MSIPGNVAATKSYTCNNMGRITVRVPCQGAGTYTLKLEHPISNPANVVAYAGRNEMYTSGGQGKPYQNCFAWVVPNSNWTGAVFHVSMTVGMPGAPALVTLYTAPPGTSMPQAYQSSSGSSCVVM